MGRRPWALSGYGEGRGMLAWPRDGQFVRSRLCMQAFAIANSDAYSHADAEPDIAGADSA